MFDRFTEDLRFLVVGAKAEAEVLGFDYVGTEHLLLSMSEAPDAIREGQRQSPRYRDVSPELAQLAAALADAGAAPPAVKSAITDLKRREKRPTLDHLIATDRRLMQVRGNSSEEIEATVAERQSSPPEAFPFSEEMLTFLERIFLLSMRENRQVGVTDAVRELSTLEGCCALAVLKHVGADPKAVLAALDRSDI